MSTKFTLLREDGMGCDVIVGSTEPLLSFYFCLGLFMNLCIKSLYEWKIWTNICAIVYAEKKFKCRSVWNESIGLQDYY